MINETNDIRTEVMNLVFKIHTSFSYIEALGNDE